MRTSVLVVVAAMAAAFAGPVQANSERVTRGDAEALHQAFNNGGWAVVLNGGEIIEGAPADFMADSAGRILPNALWNGRHFCELDWHVVSAAISEGNQPPNQSRTVKDIRDFLDTATVDIRLDGTSIPLDRSATKRTTNPERIGATVAFYVDFGRVMAPDEIAVGAHTLQLIASRGGRPPMAMPPITFHIDAAGTGTCH